MISGMLLDGDCARNVSVTNGEVKYLDGDYLIYGMLLPGVQSALSLDTMELLEDEDVDLPEEMEVSFDATDFKLDLRQRCIPMESWRRTILMILPISWMNLQINLQMHPVILQI